MQYSPDNPISPPKIDKIEHLSHFVELHIKRLDVRLNEMRKELEAISELTLRNADDPHQLLDEIDRNIASIRTQLHLMKNPPRRLHRGLQLIEQGVIMAMQSLSEER